MKKSKPEDVFKSLKNHIQELTIMNKPFLESVADEAGKSAISSYLVMYLIKRILEMAENKPNAKSTNKKSG